MDQLKDVILSTLAEIQESTPTENKATLQAEKKQENAVSKEEKTLHAKSSQKNSQQRSKENFFSEVTSKQIEQTSNGSENELLFLNSLRERLLVLFEGFQAPNNTSLEAKIDLTLNFLEYVLSTIDERIDTIKGK